MLGGAINELNITAPVGDIEVVAEHFSTAAIEPQQYGATREWARVAGHVVLLHQVGVGLVPGIFFEGAEVGRDGLDFGKNFGKGANLGLMVFGHTHIPDTVVAEMEHHAVGACGHTDAEAAIAEQCARKKINCRGITGNCVESGTLI